MVEEEKLSREEEIKQSAILFKQMKEDPFLFIKIMWGLIPHKKGEQFIKGKHISWQQVEMFQAIVDALNGDASKLISIKSGKGIGKTAFLSMATIWFLSTNIDSIVTCTGPVAKQLQDGIWKEIGVWLNKMPDGYRNQYVKTTEYLRIVNEKGVPSDTWYARVVTGTKENPAAVSGVHADNTLVIIDEAPGVEDVVMDAVQSMMTSMEKSVLLMIGNPIRNEGYFYESHNKLRNLFQTFTYSSIESPNVNPDYIEGVLRQYGSDSDEYRFNVLGEFPKQDGVDNKGWLQLLTESDLHYTSNADFKPDRLGIDPSGLGNDDSAFVGRDNFKARLLSLESKSDAKSVAGLGLSHQASYNIKGSNIWIDNFGAGANVSQEMALAGVRVNGVNVGQPAYDNKRFINARAEAYRRVREWCMNGGELVNSPKRKELTKIKYKRQLDGRIVIMSKKDMKTLFGDSPDVADALMLTFVESNDIDRDEDDSFDVDYGSKWR